MRAPRFTLRSLMILVLITALALGVGIPISRLNLSEIHDLKPRLFLLGSFLLLVFAKLGLLIGLKLKRSRMERVVEADTIPSMGSEEPLS